MSIFFSEIYGVYYTTVAKIIEKALETPIKKNDIRKIAKEYAFSESVVKIEEALTQEKWQVIKNNGETPLKNIPQMPVTSLQKRWLKAVLNDPRIRLFGDDLPKIEDAEPLFTKEDIYIFDKYKDGDLYEDEAYQRNFTIILDAVKKQYPISIKTKTEQKREMLIMPQYLEYSQKDDKFRIVGLGKKNIRVINLANIKECKPYSKVFKYNIDEKNKKTVEFELVNERNALDRVMMHFAHFEKEAQDLKDGKYLVKLIYEAKDETEILIRILSFGPMVKVVSPNEFINLIRSRLKRQKSRGH